MGTDIQVGPTGRTLLPLAAKSPGLAVGSATAGAHPPAVAPAVAGPPVSER
jgi:hypothetical protein